MNNIIAFLRQNLVMSILVALVALSLFFPKQLRRMFGGSVRRRRRKPVRRAAVSRTRKTVRRSPIRSVGGKGYPAAGGGYIPFAYNKDGSVKKAWQVAGTVAAKSRMSKLRRRR